MKRLGLFMLKKKIDIVEIVERSVMKMHQIGVEMPAE